jgi:hypothetical protein
LLYLEPPKPEEDIKDKANLGIFDKFKSKISENKGLIKTLSIAALSAAAIGSGYGLLAGNPQEDVISHLNSPYQTTHEIVQEDNSQTEWAPSEELYENGWAYDFSERIDLNDKPATPLTDFVNYNVDKAEETIDNIVEFYDDFTGGFYTDGGPHIWGEAEEALDYLGIEHNNDRLDDLSLILAEANGYENPHVYDGEELFVPGFVTEDLLDNYDFGDLDDFYWAGASTEPAQYQTAHHLERDGAMYRMVTETGVEVDADDFGEEHFHHWVEEDPFETSQDSYPTEEGMDVEYTAVSEIDFETEMKKEYRDSLNIEPIISEQEEYDPNDFLFSTYGL